MAHQGIFTDSQNPHRAVWHIHLPVMSTRGEGVSSPCRKPLHSLGLSGCAVTVPSKYHTNILRKSYMATDAFLAQNIIHCKRSKKSSQWMEFPCLLGQSLHLPSSKEMQSKDSKRSGDWLLYQEQKLSLPLQHRNPLNYTEKTKQNRNPLHRLWTVESSDWSQSLDSLFQVTPKTFSSL